MTSTRSRLGHESNYVACDNLYLDSTHARDTLFRNG